MFDEIKFDRVELLPKYVFAEVNELKMHERHNGHDVIDFSMGNPDGDTPIILEKNLLNQPKKREHMVTQHQKVFLNFFQQLLDGINEDMM